MVSFCSEAGNIVQTDLHQTQAENLYGLPLLNINFHLHFYRLSFDSHPSRPILFDSFQRGFKEINDSICKLDLPFLVSGLIAKHFEEFKAHKPLHSYYKNDALLEPQKLEYKAIFSFQPQKIIWFSNLRKDFL